MKIKHLMIVCLILAIVTLGAVSAADDIASDNLAAGDEGDAVAVPQDDELGELDEGDVDIYVEEDVSKEDTSVNFTEVSVTEKDGDFVIRTGEDNDTVELYRENLSSSDRGNYDEDEGLYYFGVSLDDINAYIADKIDPSKNFYDLVEPEQIVKFVLEYQGEDLVVDEYSVDFNDENITFTAVDDDDGIIEVSEGVTFCLIDDQDLYVDFARVTLLDEVQGNVTIRAEDRYYFNKNLAEIRYKEDDEDRDNFTIYKIAFCDLDNLDDFLDEDKFIIELIEDYEVMDARAFNIDFEDGYVTFEETEDGEVIFTVDDQNLINITSGMTALFAEVSVYGFEGNITISIDDEDESTTYFFNKNLNDITDFTPNYPHDGFTTYGISLADLDNLDLFLNQQKFEIALIDSEDEEIDSAEVGISREGDLVSFYIIKPVEGEGDKIDVGFAKDANGLTDDIIVFISKDDLPEGINGWIDVTMITEGDEQSTMEFNLDDINTTGGYFLKVSDLLDVDTIDEDFEFDLIIQFYKDTIPVCFAESDGGISVYISPYVYPDGNTFLDDWVITFREIEGADDEFNVTISKEGSEDNVLTFKISELENIAEEEDEPAFYALKVSDLNITEAGDYTISVNFTKNGEALISNYAEVSITTDLGIWTIDDSEELGSISDAVFAIRVSEEMNGYVVVYVNGVPVGNNVTFDKMFMGWGPSHGRQVWLNCFNITQTGDYNLSIDVYDENNTFLGNASVSRYIEVNGNTATFNEVYYSQGGYITFYLTSAIPEGAYFIVYLNGKKAGIFRGNVFEDVEFYDEFVDTLGYGEYDKFLKVGNYDANVTLFDGVSETDFATGTIIVKSLNATAGKEKYIEGENVTISFDADKPTKNSNLAVYLITGWGLQGPDDRLIFEISGQDLVNAWKDGKITFDIGKIGLGTNNLQIRYDYGLETADLIRVKVIEEPVDLGLTISVANIEEGSAANVVVKTNATFSGNITVQIANKDYTVEVKNGAGSLAVTGLAVNTYVATAVFAGSDAFLNATASAKFTVSKKSAAPIIKDKVTLTLKKVKVKRSAKKLVLKATLKINGKKVKGKVIKFKFKGKTYKAKTNKNGVAKVTIKKKVLKKLKKGKKVTYQATYGKVTKKYTVKVKK